MKSLEMLSLAIRITGLILAFTLLRQIPQSWLYITQISDGGASVAKYISCVSIAVVLIASILMIKFPYSLAYLLAPSLKDKEVDFNDGVKNIEVVGITIIGVYILTWAIPDLFYSVIGLWGSYKIYGMALADTFSTWLSFGITVLEIAIGLFCVVGARGIVRVINYLRG